MNIYKNYQNGKQLFNTKLASITWNKLSNNIKSNIKNFNCLKLGIYLGLDNSSLKLKRKHLVIFNVKDQTMLISIDRFSHEVNG